MVTNYQQTIACICRDIREIPTFATEYRDYLSFRQQASFTYRSRKIKNTIEQSSD